MNRIIKQQKTQEYLRGMICEQCVDSAWLAIGWRKDLIAFDDNRHSTCLPCLIRQGNWMKHFQGGNDTVIIQL